MCGISPRDGTTTILVVLGIFSFLTVLGVSVRLWHNVLRHGFSVADSFILMAFLLAVGQIVAIALMVRGGMGKDLWAVDPNNINNVLMIFLVFSCFYVSVLTFTKLSFLMFFRQIFVSETFHRLTIALGVASICQGVGFVPAVIFQCTPVSYAWTNWDGEHVGKCTNFNATVWAMAGSNTLLDILIIALPIPWLVRLSLDMRKKLQMVVLFSMGFLYGVLLLAHDVDNQPSGPKYYHLKVAKTSNFSYDYYPVIYWTVIEVDTCIIIACLPAVRQALGRLSPQLFGSSDGPSNYTSGTRPRSHKPSLSRRRARGSISALESKSYNERNINKTTSLTVSYAKRPNDESMDNVPLVEIGSASDVLGYSRRHSRM
ncbi:uncharacterized protein DSM5745_06502 [Aspergillus mulundensis]|uniref:Rhodopsin domain-containing protein n=1 Tax=Aspergillus mulundensis TaxID=1810919 RepID=A0A3D8RRB8_9EURO|nr:hypothetical protein DSM5745_06502 [Aspergillus mulundensis]RDW76510.1 hypothetical protein DSM5745_06502 [Aspergillus mulundensis]